jgi:pyruvate dehydrogenase phosphatase
LIEDRISHSTLETGKKQFQLITVMDGHGGFQVAEFMTANLPSIISQELDSGKPVEEALQSAFIKADNKWFSLVHPSYQLGFTSPIKAGACALAVLVDDTEVTVASVGDCKCVLARSDGSVLDLNIERNINREEEQARLRALHPGEEDIVKCKRSWKEEISPSVIKSFFSGCYVKGRLQPTKSFGDFHLKLSSVVHDPERGAPFLNPSVQLSHPYIDADPDITVTRRCELDRFLIAATDGLWDQFRSVEAAEIVAAALKAGLSPEQASETLVEAALINAAKDRKISLVELKALPQGSPRRNVHDDISVCVVILS